MLVKFLLLLSLPDPQVQLGQPDRQDPQALRDLRVQQVIQDQPELLPVSEHLQYLLDHYQYQVQVQQPLRCSLLLFLAVQLVLPVLPALQGQQVLLVLQEQPQGSGHLLFRPDLLAFLLVVLILLRYLHSQSRKVLLVQAALRVLLVRQVLRVLQVLKAQLVRVQGLEHRQHQQDQ